MPLRIRGEEGCEASKVGTATASIGDDGVVVLCWETGEQGERESARGVGVAIVRVQGSAAGLISGRVNVTVRREQYIHGISMDIGVDEVLHASGEHEDMVSAAAGTFVFGDEIRGSVVGDHGRFCLKIPQSFRKPF